MLEVQRGVEEEEQEVKVEAKVGTTVLAMKPALTSCFHYLLLLSCFKADCSIEMKAKRSR